MAFDHATFRTRVEAILAKVSGIALTHFDECQGTTFVDVVGKSGHHVVLQGFPDEVLGVSLSCDEGAFSGADHLPETDDKALLLIETILRTGERYPAANA